METLNAAELFAALGHESRLAVFRLLVEAGPEGVVASAIGERLGMPLYGVVVPGHFFVRYDDGKTRFNIETTSKGNCADDEHYRVNFNVPDSSDGRSIYLKNLNPHQTLGCFFNNLDFSEFAG